MLFEFPSNIAWVPLKQIHSMPLTHLPPDSLKYFTPSKWIARIMVSWGIVTICTAAVTSYEGLIVVRIFLGIAEAGFFPGIMMYLCFCEWYAAESNRQRRLT